MNTISEAINNVKALLHDRINSPFISTFLFVFLFHYWPVLFLSFDSKMNTEEKIEAINKFIKLEQNPGIAELVLCTMITIVIIAVLSIVAYFIKEFSESINKKIRNKINPDYINSKKYTETVNNLTFQINELTESNLEKDGRIRQFIRLINLDDNKKELLLKANKNGGELEKSELSENEVNLCEQLSQDGIMGRSANSYSIHKQFSVLVNGHLKI